MPKIDWKRATVLVTGGTGTLGRALIELLLKRRKPKQIVVFSRDEQKQHEMRVAGFDSARVAYRVGDVRDPKSVAEVMAHVTCVVHAAALKHVPMGEQQPLEVVRTNVLGTENVVTAALQARVPRLVLVSTDKAVEPINVYGATKLIAERLVLGANERRDNARTRCSVVRYGNVLGSRGSVAQVLLEQRRRGHVTLTDPHMTRFWFSAEEAAAFVVRSLDAMRGGETFVPKMKSASVVDLVNEIAPGAQVETIGRRGGEKVHEVLISADEALTAIERPDMFVLLRPGAVRRSKALAGRKLGSDDAERLSPEELRVLCAAALEATTAHPREVPRERPQRHGPAVPRLVR